VPITFRLRTLDNEDAGTFATQLSDWQPSVELGAGNRSHRIVSIEDEFDPWWLEPVGRRRHCR